MKTLAFFFVLATAADGRLGETVEQCVARYGPDLFQKKNEGWYEKNGIGIHAEFRNHLVVKISYWKKPKELFSVDHLSDFQVQEILKANSGKSTWLQTKGAPGASITHKTLTRADLAAHATWDYLSGEVRFITESERQLEAAEKAREEAKRHADEKKAVDGL